LKVLHTFISVENNRLRTLSDATPALGLLAGSSAMLAAGGTIFTLGS
jgi:hypothetical protein